MLPLWRTSIACCELVIGKIQQTSRPCIFLIIELEMFASFLDSYFLYMCNLKGRASAHMWWNQLLVSHIFRPNRILNVFNFFSLNFYVELCTLDLVCEGSHQIT